MAEQPRLAGVEYPLRPMIAVTADQLALGPVTGRLSRPRRGAAELVVWNDGHLDFAAL
jgi:hypothetical protein